MDNINYQKLSEILSQPPYPDLTDKECLQELKQKTHTKITDQYIAREDIDPLFFLKLQHVAKHDMVVSLLLDWLNVGKLNVGSDSVRLIFGGLIDVVGITKNEVQKVLDLALEPITVVEFYGWKVLTNDILKARMSLPKHLCLKSSRYKHSRRRKAQNCDKICDKIGDKIGNE